MCCDYHKTTVLLLKYTKLNCAAIDRQLQGIEHFFILNLELNLLVNKTSSSTATCDWCSTTKLQKHAYFK